MLNVTKLQAAVDRRASRSQKEKALATELGNQGCKGQGMRRGASTHFTTNRGNVVLAADGTVRLANRGDAHKVELPSVATIRKRVYAYSTEKAQAREAAVILAEAGLPIDQVTKPAIHRTSYDGKLVRVYVWKTPGGLLVLSTGPAFDPEIKLIEGDEYIDAIPAEVPIGFASEVGKGKAEALMSGISRSATRARREAPEPSPAPRTRRTSAKPSTRKPRTTSSAPKPAETKPRKPRSTAGPRTAPPAPPPSTAAEPVTMAPSLSQAELDMLTKAMQSIVEAAD